MFSERAGFELSPNELSAAIAARRRASRPFDDLTDANPTRHGLREPSRALVEALPRLAQDPRALSYEPDPRGGRAAREAVASYYRARGASVDPDHVLLTAGTSEAYAHLFRLLANPGDTVLVPRPSYPLFDLLASFEGLEAVGYPTRVPLADGAFSLDLEVLAARLGPRTRAILAVHPHNPTGVYLSSAERRGLRTLARDRGCGLIVDEVFLDFPVSADHAEPSLLASDTEVGRLEPTEGPLCFVLSGVSKTLALPQLKLAWIVVDGPAALRDEALARLEVIADTFLAVSALPQILLPGLLEAAPSIARELGARLRENHAFLTAASAQAPGVHALPAAGGWSAILRVEGAEDAGAGEDELTLRLLEEADVLVQPGWLFDLEPPPGGGAHLVTSLLAEPARFRAAARRLVDACARWRDGRS